MKKLILICLLITLAGQNSFAQQYQTQASAAAFAQKKEQFADSDLANDLLNDKISIISDNGTSFFMLGRSDGYEVFCNVWPASPLAHLYVYRHLTQHPKLIRFEEEEKLSSMRLNSYAECEQIKSTFRSANEEHPVELRVISNKKFSIQKY